MYGNPGCRWVLAIGVIWVSGAVSAFGQYEPPTYIARYVNLPPVIDGELTSPTEWSMASAAATEWTLWGSGVDYANDAPDTTRNRFVALWDDRGLYVQHQVDYDGWDQLGFGALDSRYERLSLYFDPNKDGETNDQSGPLDTGIDGYQLVFNQPLGRSELLEVGTFAEAHVNRLSGDQREPWSHFNDALMVQNTSTSPGYGYTELFIPWSDFDASNPDIFTAETDDVGLYHPDAPLDGEEWFFNIARVETFRFGTMGTVPAWALAPGTRSLPQRPHGILQFSKTSAVLGDFNGDGLLTAIDINMLSTEVRDETHDPAFDLDQDTFVTSADRAIWVEQLQRTYFGDGNLDGEFNTGDLVDVLMAGQYEDGIAGNSLWETGDWNGNGDFDTADFVLVLTSGGFEMGPKRLAQAAQAVPEPCGLYLLLLALLGLELRRRRPGWS